MAACGSGGICVGGCMDTCSGGCVLGCGIGCYSSCNTCGSNCHSDCEGGCKNACGSHCIGKCYGGCSDTCKNTCSGGCSGGCNDNCNSNCSSCSGTCSGGCDGSCYNSCSGGCGGGCKGTCTSCSGTCNNTCTGGCGSNCLAGCVGYCNAGCAGKAMQDTFNSMVAFNWNNPVGSRMNDLRALLLHELDRFGKSTSHASQTVTNSGNKIIYGESVTDNAGYEVNSNLKTLKDVEYTILSNTVLSRDEIENCIKIINVFYETAIPVPNSDTSGTAGITRREAGTKITETGYSPW